MRRCEKDIIILEKQIENLVTWIYGHCATESDFRKALEECHIPNEDINAYCED